MDQLFRTEIVIEICSHGLIRAIGIVCVFVVLVQRPANSSELFPDCLNVMFFAQVLNHNTRAVIESMR